jgi:cell fate (sporulation/competence/biofilm development) regulator YlbF (YheA/YmcA/DUF963 family)
MNFYDEIYNMVRKLKETNEYKDYINQKENIKRNPEEYELLKQFKEKQRVHQVEYINSGKLDEDKQRQLQLEYSKLIQSENIKKLFESEIKLDVILADMQKIIAEGIKEILEF